MKGDDGAAHVHVSVARIARSSSRRTRSSRCRRSTRRTSTARSDLGLAGRQPAADGERRPRRSPNGRRSGPRRRCSTSRSRPGWVDGRHVSWMIDAREGGPAAASLIYQGVLSTELGEDRRRRPARRRVGREERDLHERPGHGCRRRRSVINPPGEAVDDWQILTSVARRSACRSPTRAPQQVRADIAAGAGRNQRYAEPRGTGVQPAGPAAHWLQASNPMERWKWDSCFQDLPPVKGHTSNRARAAAAGDSPEVKSKKSPQSPSDCAQRLLDVAIALALAAPVSFTRKVRPRATTSRRLSRPTGCMRAPGARGPDRHAAGRAAHPVRTSRAIPSSFRRVLTVDAPAGVQVDALVFPPPKDFKQGRAEAARGVRARFRGRRRAQPRVGSPEGESSIPARLRYQACDDKLCFQPRTETTEWKLRIVPPATKVAATAPEVFTRLRRPQDDPPAASAATAPVRRRVRQRLTKARPREARGVRP